MTITKSLKHKITAVSNARGHARGFLMYVWKNRSYHSRLISKPFCTILYHLVPSSLPLQSPPLRPLISPHSSPPSLVLSASALSRGITTQHPSSRADHASLPMRLPSLHLSAPSAANCTVTQKYHAYAPPPSIGFALENCFFPARDFSQPGCETRVRCATVIAY